MIVQYHQRIDQHSGKTGNNSNPQPKSNRRDQLVLHSDNKVSSLDDTLNDGRSEVSDDNSVCSVGDNDSVHSVSDHEVDELLGQPVPVMDDNVTVDSIINEEYCEEESVPHLPPIDDKLSELLTKWLCNAPSREKIKELFKQCMLPSNVEVLKPVRINDLLYEKLSFQYKANDQRLRGINTYFDRGLGPIILVWDQILKWETALSGDRKKKVSVSMSTLQMQELSLDLSAVRKLMDKGLCLLCAGHSVVLLKRKAKMCPYFDPKFHYLLKHTNPVTSELLGDNVDVKIAEFTKLSEGAHCLQVWRNFHGHSRTYRPHANQCPFNSHQHFSRKCQDAAQYQPPASHRNFHGKRGRYHSHRGHTGSHNRGFPHRK